MHILKEQACRHMDMPAGTEENMIERFKIHFAPGSDEHMVSVYLPRGYHESDEAYPVMYMFDGQNAFEEERAAYRESWNLHEFMDQWEKNLLIVGIESSQESDRRLAEYCPYHLSPKVWEGLRGRGRATAEWLIGTLKPEIDRRYRTMGDRLCTGVMGASLGGLMSFYMVTAFNDVFSKAACLSVPSGLCFPQLRAQARESAMDSDTRIYLSVGEKEARDQRMLAGMVGRSLQLSNVLMGRGMRVYPYLQEGGRHCEEDWRTQTSEFMRFLWLE